MVEYTPGPWTLKGPSKTLWCWSWDDPKGYAGGGFDIMGNVPEGQVRTVAMLTWNERDAVERAANARLIAAAPDLLEALTLSLRALEEAETILGSEYGDQYGPLCELMAELHEKARAAILRATEPGDER
jgi:hypothetical protein